MTQQAPQLDARSFIENVVASGLMTRDEATRALKGMPETDRGKVVARYLVKNDYLTRFQAERLLWGKTDGFHLGQYRILDELGRGGMGRVFKAMHQTMGRQVALKVLAPDLTKTDRAKELFRREVRAAAKLNHPNIVTAYDANQAGDRCFLAMEFVDGPNLSQLVKEKGRLGIEEACEYIRQAALGLAYAHGLGLVHRDVKPANLLVQKGSGGPLVKILDFGLAQVTMGEDATAESAATGTHSVLGTPDYISPEQARNHKAVDGRSDLYSLGCTFYYLLTGQVPFPGGTALEKIVRHNAEAPAAVQSLRPEVPEPISVIVHKLLAKNPKWRHQSAAELAIDLGAFVGDRADWSSPLRPAIPAPSDAAVELGSNPDGPWTSLADESPSNTVANGAMATQSDPSVADQSHRALATGLRRPRLAWPWLVLIAAWVLAVVAGIAIAVWFALDRAG